MMFTSGHRGPPTEGGLVAALEVPDDAIWFYKDGGLSCAAVASMFSVSESTANRWMHAAGVIRSDDTKKSRPLEDECSRGHDQSEWRRRGRDNQTYCLLCKRERARENYAANKVQRAMEPDSYGEESGSFGLPHPVEPGACPRCGAYPACTPLKES